jgi:dTDP-4-amino-4,6-dideoxygalactose transaminase
VLNVKLPRLNQWVDRRRAIAQRYRDALQDVPGLHLPDGSAGQGHGWNQFVVRVTVCPTEVASSDSHRPSEFGLPSSHCRDWLKQSLQERGVSTIIYYPIPIHCQPAYAEQQQGTRLTVTEQLCSEVLSLPIFPELSSEQQEQVISVLRSLLIQNAPVDSQTCSVAA